MVDDARVRDTRSYIVERMMFSCSFVTGVTACLALADGDVSRLVAVDLADIEDVALSFESSCFLEWDVFLDSAELFTA